MLNENVCGLSHFQKRYTAVNLLGNESLVSFLSSVHTSFLRLSAFRYIFLSTSSAESD